MPRSTLRRLTRPRFVHLGAVLLALGLSAAGCSDDTPRAGSADLAASRKAAAEKGPGGLHDFGPRTGDLGPTRTRAKAKASPSAGPADKTQGKTR